jgi:hypothetical protein
MVFLQVLFLLISLSTALSSSVFWPSKTGFEIATLVKGNNSKNAGLNERAGLQFVYNGGYPVNMQYSYITCYNTSSNTSKWVKVVLNCEQALDGGVSECMIVVHHRQTMFALVEMLVWSGDGILTNVVQISNVPILLNTSVLERTGGQTMHFVFRWCPTLK